MACRPKDNPRSASSDGVPPELVVLGLREAALCPTGLTGWWGTSSGCDCCDPTLSGACILTNSVSTPRYHQHCSDGGVDPGTELFDDFSAKFREGKRVFNGMPLLISRWQECFSSPY